jgi:deoxyribose-phosphate aldolase
MKSPTQTCEPLSASSQTLKKAALAEMIDHTLLKPEATENDIRRLCQEAIEYGFKGVCVNSGHIALVADLLRDQKPLPVAVVGFPLGAILTSVKVFETREVIKLGAKEIDMVINLGALKSGDEQKVLADIQAVTAAAAPVLVKVIIEAGSLEPAEKITACRLAMTAGAAFVKTSTGFAGTGATVADIELMRRSVGDRLGIKASGGIKTRDDAERLIKAGATRIGTSASIAILNEN